MGGNSLFLITHWIIMPNGDQNPLTDTIVAGESLTAQESKDKPEVVEETTKQQQNEESNIVNDQPAEEINSEAVTEEVQKTDSKPYVSGSAKARELGERTRKLASTLIQAAKDNSEVKDQLKKLAETDTSVDKYLRKHWSKEYKGLMEDLVAEDNEEVGETEETVTVDSLAEHLKEQRQEQAYELAEKLSFTRKEAEALVRMASKLDGEEISNKKIDFTEALRRAAYLVRPEKARVGLTSVGSLPKSPSPVQIKNAKEDEMIDWYSKKFGKDPEKVKENLREVDSNFKNGVFTFPL